jgi:hypothetical protein
MSEHFEAVEADFQRYYGLDLREVLWGEARSGVRRILSLVNGLPMEGATFRATVTKGRSWSTTDELLATLIELTDFTNRILFSVNKKESTRVWDPIHISRPTDVPPLPAKSEELLRMFGGSVQYAGDDD